MNGKGIAIMPGGTRSRRLPLLVYYQQPARANLCIEGRPTGDPRFIRSVLWTCEPHEPVRWLNRVFVLFDEHRSRGSLRSLTLAPRMPQDHSGHLFMGETVEDLALPRLVKTRSEAQAGARARTRRLPGRVP